MLLPSLCLLLPFVSHCSALGDDAKNFTAPGGPGGNPIYVLDVTPVYSGFPRAVRLGLDPTLASWKGIPELDPQWQAYYNTSTSAAFTASNIPPWERTLFPSAPESTCQHRPLRWHRVYALGHHLRWTRRGITLMLPPKGTLSAVFPSEYSAADLERDRDSSLPFFDYEGTGAVVTEGGQTRLRYPFLAYRAEQQPQECIAYALSASGGLTGQLGWLGVPSALYTNPVIGPYTPTSSLISLEIAAFINVSAVVPQQQPLGAMDQVELSAAEEEGLMFWGLWGDAANMQGNIPPAIHGVGAAEVPLSYFGGVNVSSFIPDYPFASHMASLDDCEVPAEALEGGRLWEEVAAEVGNFTTPEGITTMALAVMAWEMVVSNSAFGATAGSFELALTNTNGFVRWPGPTIDMLSSIEASLAREQVLLLPGGCTGQVNNFAALISCE